MTSILKLMGIQQWGLRRGSQRQSEAKPTPSLPLSGPSLEPGDSVVEPDVSLQYRAAIEQQGFGVEHSITEQNLEPTPASEALKLEPKAMPIAAPKVGDGLNLKPTPPVLDPNSNLSPVSKPVAMPVATAAPAVAYDQASAQEKVSRDPIETLDWQGLQALIEGQNQCNSCGHKNSSLGTGDANANWLFVSDAPTSMDLQQQQLFSGRAGQLYESMLSAVGHNRASVYTTSVFKCTTSDDITSVPNCDKILQRQIALVKPKVIIAFGEFASQSIAKSNDGLESLLSQELVCHATKIPIIASYNPLQLLDEPRLKAGAWNDLKKCIAITR